MKKRFAIGLIAISLLTGCSSSSKENQSSACTFAAAEGMDINVTVSAQGDTINKMKFTVEMSYEKLGYDLSDASDSIKESTVPAILELLGLDEDSNGITVKTSFKEKSFVATGEINLEKAEDAVLETFGFTNVNEDQLSYKKFLSDAKDSGVTCK